MSEPTPPPRPRSLGLYLRGIVMGSADLIPGVSGGTMALILGIYPVFVDALSSLNVRFVRPALTSLVKKGPARVAARASAARHLVSIHWGVLVPLGFGILTAIALGSRLIKHVLSNHPVETYSFFFGLILASLPIPYRMLERRGAKEAALALSGAAGTFILVGLPALHTTDATWFLAVCGALAICAMVLPGISGSYVLLMLGQYERVIDALNDKDLLSLGVLVTGMAVGLLGFSRALRWLLHHRATPTLAVLLGVMAGALRAVWPFREVALRIGTKTIERAVLPDAFGASEARALGFAVLGAAALLALDQIGRRMQKG